jgi:hypothetical protein
MFLFDCIPVDNGKVEVYGGQQLTLVDVLSVYT